jgi:hypothetical protein
MNVSVVGNSPGPPRAGHATAWARGSLYSFGGIPDWETYETDEHEVHCPRGCEYAGMLEWQPLTLGWRMHDSAEYPRARHGHQMLLSGGSLWVVGGHLFAFGNEQPVHELAFDLETKQFRVPTLLVHNRFAASCCPLPRLEGRAASWQPGDDTSFLLFGGLDESREPCNDLLCFDVARNVCYRHPAIGTSPAAQFKGGMCLDREGRRAFVFDGYTESGVQKVHMLTHAGRDTLVWRSVCGSAPLVRFALTPIYGGTVLVLLGGMDRRHRQRRVCTAHFFSLRDLKWTNAVALEGFEPRTAHCVAVVPPEMRGIVGGTLVVFGGCVELDDTPNNRGRTVGTVTRLQVHAPTLKYIAAVELLRLVPVEQWLPKAAAHKDEILDELF